MERICQFDVTADGREMKCSVGMWFDEDEKEGICFVRLLNKEVVRVRFEDMYLIM